MSSLICLPSVVIFAADNNADAVTVSGDVVSDFQSTRFYKLFIQSTCSISGTTDTCTGYGSGGSGEDGLSVLYLRLLQKQARSFLGGILAYGIGADAKLDSSASKKV